MKQNNLIKRVFIAIAMILTVSVAALAHDFEVDGIYYGIISSYDKTCEVTYKGTSYSEYSNEYIGEIIVPESVTFEGTTYSVTSIGDAAFRNCSGLTSVTIPESVTSIGDAAFRNCSGLTSITIPNSVTSINGNVFSSCSDLESIIVESGNTMYDSRNNCNAIIETSTNTLIVGCKNTTIPNSVTNIASAFYGCSGLTNITIPESVTNIDSWSFYNCSRLKTVEVKSMIPPSLDSRYTFSTSIIVVPFNAIYTYKNSSYWGGYKYASHLIDGFYYLPINETEVEVTYKDANYNSYSGEIEIPTEIIVDDIKYKVTSIGSSAFNGCSNLTNVIMPNGITSIGSHAFYNCSGLISVIIPEGVTSINHNTFYSCRSLTSVTIPNSVTSIGNYAFNGCYNLTSIEIPDGVTNIGDCAFSDTKCKLCKVQAQMPPYLGKDALPSSMSFVVVPESGAYVYLADEQWNKYTIIGEGACDIEVTNETAGQLSRSILEQTRKNLNNITGLTVHGTLNADDIEKINSNMTSLLHLDISDTDITEIPANAFKNKTTMLSIKLPNELTTIGDYAFSNTSLSEKLTFPETLETIGNYTFQDCSILKGGLKLPSSIKQIGISCFSGCKGLTSVEISDLEAWCNIDFSNSDSNPLSCAHNLYLNGELITSLEIPKNIKEIKRYTFSGCMGLKKVIIPNNIKGIGDGAFCKCTNLTIMEISNSVTNIGDYTFYGCSGLTSITIPNSVTSIGSSALEGCNTLQEVDLSAATKLESLSSYAFKDCSNLETIKLNNTLKSIGSSAFYGCNKLGCVEFPLTIEKIDDYAFSGCENLKMLELSNCESLTSISNSTFENCSSIETVNFPSTLISIGTNAFANCKNLLHMSVPCTIPPAIVNDAEPFRGVDNVACILSIPTESFFDYWDANYWGGFVDVENKSDIQIEVTNPEDEFKPSIPGVLKYLFGCLIQYYKHHFDKPSHRAMSLNNIRASLTEEVVEKVDDKNKALTAGGQSVFVGNGEAVTFYFTPEDGKEIDKVLFNGEDVTSELVNNTYTTSAVTEMSSLQVILRQGTLTEIEETLVSEEGEVEYYNLQGVKVVNPSSGLYIKKQGNKVTKVIL